MSAGRLNTFTRNHLPPLQGARPQPVTPRPFFGCSKETASMSALGAGSGRSRRSLATGAGASNRLHMIILGPPGSGKGTQTERLLKKFDIRAVGAGDLLRQEITKGSPVGKQAADVMKAGGLLPDEIVLKLVEPELVALKSKNWLLDGFPRKASQAALLDEVLGTDGGAELNLVVNLGVPDRVIMERIEARWIHAPSGRTYNDTYNPPKVKGIDDVTGEPLSRRPDDNPETFKKRLESYHRENNPLLDYYRDATTTLAGTGEKVKKLVTLEGETSDIIYPQLERLVESRFPLLPRL